MARVSEAGEAVSTGSEPAPSRVSWRLIGPGIVVAATGVGSGDLVATLIAGSRFGYALFWAVIAGTIVKIALAEATGRWHLATGRTIFDGWSSLGRWTLVYFGIYVVVWGFVYGATAMSATGLPLAAHARRAGPSASISSGSPSRRWRSSSSTGRSRWSWPTAPSGRSSCLSWR
ncbi:Nramp family divalent metal transporter [Lutibaculum baratangense]|uniref:Putative metal ion transport protein n=1 Tax=Lutibaculum baratangense AMV1 TaxID=631454 RepID=V4RGH7_9HYPH|nr:Nramp family divalent metal transporter [Lutibaculum baratangense]ESR25261.1 putative metal ion transport protein [Lutibaculum baratangense AMV1]